MINYIKKQIYKNFCNIKKKERSHIMNYTPLRVKTSYSILSSLNNIPKLVSLAKEYGYKSLAITDENNMFGVMEFYQECKKNNIKPIIGIELTTNNT